MTENNGEKVSVEAIVRNALAEAKRLESIEKAEKKVAEKTEKESVANENSVETFNCPECQGKVAERAKYCPNCGLELEWGD